MNLKKVVISSAIATSALFVFAAGENTEAQAAEWTPRTADQVSAEITDEGGVKVYTIKPGDTLSTIASAVNMDYNALADLNEIENANLIYPGNKLYFEEGANGQVDEVVAGNDQSQAAPVQQAPAQQNTSAQQAAPVETYQSSAQTYNAPAETSAPAQSQSSGYTGQSSSAKDIIAQRESGGNYGASNGQYVGKYQLSASYLNGDYSPENQERVADQYVSSRYGSWDNALSFWNANGWY